MLNRRAKLTVKHAFDRLIAALLLALLSPLFVVVATLIRLEDGGPVFFTQARTGEGGDAFLIFKFRTMIPDADRYLDAEGRPTRARVTRIGKYLRRWSVDELPQLYNVLRGEMSLVGPRPVPVELADRMTPAQRGRFEMRPGLTGLAQVTGRHRLTWSERIELDLDYVRRFSFGLDAAILARTIPAILDPQTLIERGDPRKVDLG